MSKEEEEHDSSSPTQRYLERGTKGPLDSSFTADPKSPLRYALGDGFVTGLPFAPTSPELDVANMPSVMADVLYSIRTSASSFDGGGLELDESDTIRMLWENQGLFTGSTRVGIRALDTQSCKGLRMSEQGSLMICGQPVEPGARTKRAPTCDSCKSGEVSIREPDGDGKMSKRAGGKFMIGQSGFLASFHDDETENLSAVLEPGALVDVLRRLSVMEAGAREAYDEAVAFSRLMSVLVKSAAGLECDSKSMCVVRKDSDDWLYQYLNTDSSTASARVSIRARHTEACWAEEDEKIERGLAEDLHIAVNASSQRLSEEAERLEASLDSSPFIDTSADQVFKTGSGSNFSPVMTESLGPHPLVQKYLDGKCLVYHFL